MSRERLHSKVFGASVDLCKLAVGSLRGQRGPAIGVRGPKGETLMKGETDPRRPEPPTGRTYSQSREEGPRRASTNSANGKLVTNAPTSSGTSWIAGRNDLGDCTVTIYA